MRTFFYKLWKHADNTIISHSATLIGISQMKIGHNCHVDPFCFLKSEGSQGELKIGDNVHINRFSHISAKDSKIHIHGLSTIGYNNWIGGRGNITIKKNFISGMNIVIISSNHDYYDISVPYCYGKEIKNDIYIGENVWIGANSVILPGTSIGDGSVIGAGSIVSGDIPQNVMAAGNPVKAIKTIDRINC